MKKHQTSNIKHQTSNIKQLVLGLLVCFTFYHSYSATLIPRVTAPTPYIICENEVTFFDFKGAFLPQDIPVQIKGNNIPNSIQVTSSGGYFTATYAIRTRPNPNGGTPLYDLAIVPGTVTTIDWTGASNGMLLSSGTVANNGIGSIQMEILYPSNGSNITDKASFQITMGWKPNFAVLDHNGNAHTNWLSKIIPSCMSDEVSIRSLGLNCNSPKLGLSVTKYNYDHVDRVFTSTSTPEFILSGTLTAQELVNLKSTSGLDVADIINNASRSTTGTSSITFEADFYYGIKIINTDHGRWQETIKFIQINGTKWDLVLKDNNSDNGQEPIEVWERDVFKSPDLWNRLNDPSQPNPTNFSDHEDLDYVNTAGNTNRMFYEVTNIGCDPSPADVPLRLYCTRARTNEQWNQDWIYDLSKNAIDDKGTLRPLGSEITISSPTNNTYRGRYLSAYHFVMI